MTFLPLKDLLPRAIRAARISDQVQAAQALEACRTVFPAAVPPAVAKATELLYIRHNVLMVRVLSPSVAQELRLREREILRQVNARSPMPIERLGFRMAENG